MSNLYFSQNTNINLTKVNSGHCYSEAQVNEIFKGLKQAEYLKIRLQKTEETLQNANKVVSQQKDIIISKTEAINLKDEIIKQNQIVYNKDKEILNSNIERLKNEKELIKLEYKKESRKQFWKGVKIGGITVGILGTGTVIYLLAK